MKMKKMRIKFHNQTDEIDDVTSLSDSEFRRYIMICRQAIRNIDRRIENEDRLAEANRPWLGEDWRNKALASRMAYEENLEILEFEMQEKFGYTISRAEKFYELAKEMLDPLMYEEINSILDRTEGKAS